MSNWSKSLGVLTLLSLATTNAQAMLIESDTASSVEQLGLFQAEVTWDGSSLHIELTNTSDPANGGYITGFLLNLPGDDLTFSSTTTDSNMQPLLPGGGPYSASPFGQLEYGYSLGADFLSGTNPAFGIGVGETAHFTFSDFTGLPEGSELWTHEEFEYFLLDYPVTPRGGDTSFFARFRGFNDGGSDKVPSLFVTDEPPPPPPPPPPPTTTSWDCVTNVCTERQDNLGTYATLKDCRADGCEDIV